MMFSFSKERNIVGIDIGSNSLKLVRIDGDAGAYTLKACASVPIDREIVEGGIIRDPQGLTDALKDLFKAARCTVKNVATALSGHSVIIKKTTFRTMEEEALRELIIDDASEYIPFGSIDNVDFDVFILGENEINIDQMNVIIAAAKKDVVSSFTSAIEAAGKQAVIVDVDSFALETAYGENYIEEEQTVAALVNIGASITNINIVRNGASIFTRNILLGGNTVTERLKDKRKISFDEAERIKTGDGSEPDALLRQELLSYAEPIILEIERSIDYLASTSGGPVIKKMLISGGSARLAGIEQALAERLRCEVEIFDPFRNIDCDTKKFGAEYLAEMRPLAAIAVGLALRRIGDS